MADLNTKQINFTAAQVEKAVNFALTQVAEPFSTSSTYAVDDYVTYDGFLYQCTTAITEAGAWDSTKWQIQKIFDNDGYVIIKGGEAPTPPLIPVKGKIINMNLDGSIKQYRLLKNISGDVWEVFAMTSVDVPQMNSPKLYEGNYLDTYLNITWYNTLTSDAKAAIVDKTFTQDSWWSDDSGNPDYSGKYLDTLSEPHEEKDYTISLGNIAYGNSITRHVYALSVQDVLDYVSDISTYEPKLHYKNIWKMFWDNEEPQSTEWTRFRSAFADESEWSADDIICVINGGRILNSLSTSVRPALQIDLSKISWS